MQLRIGTAVVGMSIRVHGHEVEEYQHAGETFIWARHGTEYQICVWNFTSGRVEAVIAVDGLSITTGQDGSFADRGYALPSSAQRISIPGFRLNDQQVAQFVFNSAQASYASQIGKPRNIGVIGAAFFVEKPKPEIPLLDTLRSGGRGDFFRYSQQDLGDLSLKSATRGMPGHSRHLMAEETLSAPTMGPSAGTEFGRPVDFFVHQTEFERQDPTNPAAVLAIRYETRERLLELGVDIERRPKPEVVSPNPFPGEPVLTGCPPPPNWRRRHAPTR